MGNGGIIAAIFLLSLFFSTAFISYFNIEFNGDNSVKLIKLPNQLSDSSNSTNFVDSCSFSEYDITGSWACISEGLQLVGEGSLRVPLKQASNDGIYTNTYNLINTQGDYTIIVTDTKFGDYIHIKVKNDGLYIPSTIALPIIGHYESGTAYYQPIDNANIQDRTTIKTIYNINSNELTIEFNGETYIPDYTVLPPNYLAPAEVTSTQGIIDSKGLTIESMSKNYVFTQTELGSVVNGIPLTANVAYSMLKLATYTFPYDILPLEYQLLLIFPQEFLILIGCAIFLREG